MMKMVGNRPIVNVARSPETHVPHDAEVYEDEAFVVDDRVHLRPSEHVQSKLLTLLPAVAVPVSCLHTHRETRRQSR